MGQTRKLCVLAVILAGGALAHAEPNPEAEKLFRDGRAFIKQGKLADACDAFAASNKLEPSVGTLLNLGDCRSKRGQTATAWASFVEAGRLAKKQGDRRQGEADRRAAELEPRLSYLVIKVDALVVDEKVSRDTTPIDPAVFGQPVALDPGNYEVRAQAPGFVAWSQKVTVKPDGDRQTVRVPALSRPVVAATPVAAPTDARRDVRAGAMTDAPGDARADASIDAPRDVPASRFTTRRKIALAAGAVGVVALGAGTVLALQAKSLHGDARKVCPAGQPCHDLAASQKSERAVSRANAATAVGIVGVAALGAGAVLWVIGAPQESSRVARVVPTATPDSVGLTVIGSF